MSVDRKKSVSAPVPFKGVRAKDGILLFDSLETFEQTYPTILNMDAEQSALWERSVGFVSQRNIFNQIVEAEYGYLVKPYENKSDEALKRMKAPQGHTNVYRKYLRAGVIKIERVEGEDTYDYALTDRSYAPIANTGGFYIVGDTVHQVKGDLAKEMRGGDLSKLSLLAKAKSSDPANKIVVRPVIDVSAASAAQSGLSGCSFPLSSNWVTSGSRRGLTTVNFYVSYLNPFPYTKVIINYTVEVRSQKKNFWGTWVYPSCPNECWIGGAWTLNFDYMNGATLGHAFTNYFARSYSYQHPNCINLFQASINPVASGVSAPFSSSFIFTAPKGLAFLGVRLTPVQWSVSVPGGASGISCGVSC